MNGLAVKRFDLGGSRLFVIGSLFIAAAAIASVAVLLARGAVMDDWLSFYTFGLLVRTGNAAHLYDFSLQTAMHHELAGADASIIAYPLFVGALLAPLTWLSLDAGYIVWFALNLALLGALAWLSWRWLADVAAPVRAVFLLCALTITMRALLLGQVDLFVLAGFAGCYALLRSGRPFTGGSIFALALIKPHLVVAVVLLLLCKRQWRALAGFSFAGGLLLIVPPLAVDPHLLVDQVRLMISFTGATTGYGVDARMMVNIRGTAVSLTGSSDPWLWLPPLALTAAVAFGTALRVWLVRAPLHAQSWALALTLPLLYSPHVHFQSLVLLTAAAALYLIDSQSSGQPPIQIKHVLYGLLAVTLLWGLTFMGVALMAFLIMAVYSAFSLRWPEPATQAAAVPARSSLAYAA